jgi:GNAT superfamily N-acetyltransferase
MIRPATVEDVETIVDLGEIFHGQAGWADIADYVGEDCAASLTAMVESPDAIVLVAEEGGEIVGMAGGVTYPLYFNRGHRSGQELFWWVRPGCRVGGKLLEALEGEARLLGCQSWAMIALDKIEPELMGRLYRRRGYRASEHTYMKRL